MGESPFPKPTTPAPKTEPPPASMPAAAHVEKNEQRFEGPLRHAGREPPLGSDQVDPLVLGNSIKPMRIRNSHACSISQRVNSARQSGCSGLPIRSTG